MPRDHFGVMAGSLGLNSFKAYYFLRLGAAGSNWAHLGERNPVCWVTRENKEAAASRPIPYSPAAPSTPVRFAYSRTEVHRLEAKTFGLFEGGAETL